MINRNISICLSENDECPNYISYMQEKYVSVKRPQLFCFQVKYIAFTEHRESPLISFIQYKLHLLVCFQKLYFLNTFMLFQK